MKGVFVGMHVFLTNAGLNEIHPHERDKYKGTLVVTKVEKSTISYETEDKGLKGRTQPANLMFCRG